MQLRTRLLLVGAALPLALMIATTAIAGLVFERVLLAEHDQALLGQAAVEAVSLFDRANSPHLHLLDSPLENQLRDFPPRGVLYGPDGARVTGYPDLETGPERLDPREIPREASLITVDTPAGRDRVLEVRVDDPQGRPHALWLAASLDRHDREMATYWQVSGLVVTIAGLFLLLGQWIHARSLSTRVGNLSAHMRRLRAGTLDQVPPEDLHDDEIAELRQAIAETTVRLDAARTSQDRLVADAAHELRTPLATLRAGIDVALRRERSIDELRATLEQAREEVDRLAALASSLLDLAALRASPLERRPGDLVGVLVEAVDAARMQAEERGLLVRMHAPDSAAAEFAAPALRQALDNLLGNAIKFSPAGGEIAIALGREGAQWCFRVLDCGPGVPESERAAIFEPFHRVALDRPGKGLGLAIVRDVAERHGGRVWVEGRECGGAAFCLALPG
ncbi:ATP-binding protein [Nannocystaceae bacterium ST9]